MIEKIIEFLLALVALVIGGTMAFATFFIAQEVKQDRLRRK